MITIYYLCIISMGISSHLIHGAQAAAHSPLPPTYMQQYAHCSNIMYKTFASTLTSLTPEQAAQMAHGPQHFVTAHVLGTSFIESLHQQRADHGSLDAATLTTVAHVHAATQHELTATGHVQGLATKDDVQKVMDETKKMREEVAQIKIMLAEKEAAAHKKNCAATTESSGLFDWLNSSSTYNFGAATTTSTSSTTSANSAPAKSSWISWLSSGSSRYNLGTATTASAGSTTSATPAPARSVWLGWMAGGSKYGTRATAAASASEQSSASIATT